MRYDDIRVGMKVVFNDGHGVIEDAYVIKMYPGNPFVRLAVRRGKGWRDRLAYERELERRD